MKTAIFVVLVALLVFFIFFALYKENDSFVVKAVNAIGDFFEDLFSRIREFLISLGDSNESHRKRLTENSFYYLM